MKRILASLVLLASAATASAEAAFAHKVAKVVAGYAETRSTLANFPVLVRIPSATAAECRADGADIRFTSSDGATVYPHEIDAWNPGGESTVWVLLPEMKNGTSFVMEWGDPDYAAPETPWAKGAVWDPAGYAGVWHMTEASGNVTNATSKTAVGGVPLDAIPSGTRAAYSVRSADAPIGFARDTGAQDMNHDSNGRAFLRVPNYDNLELGSTFTISGWWKITDYHGNYDGNHRTRNGRMFSRKNAWNMNGGFEFALNNSTTVASIAGGASDNNSPKVAMSGFANNNGAWVHMAFVYNGATATAFVNGVQKASGTISPATDCGLDLGIGSNVGNANGVYNNDSYVVGLFDEMRLQSLRSDVAYADWFAAEYAMGADAAFLEDHPISQTTPVVSIAISSATAREWRNEGQTITLSRSSDSAWGAITVGLSFAGSQSLVSGLPGSVTMQAGVTTVTLPIAVEDNDDTDGDRTFTATVLPGEGYDIGTPASVSLTVLDDETHAQTCSWTGRGDGTLWSDGANWSSLAAPTEIDTVVFGDGVAGDVSVTFAADEPPEALLVRFETAHAVTLGAAGGPSVPAFDFLVEEGAGRVSFAAEFVFSSSATITAAEGTEVSFSQVSGEGDLTMDGAGTVDLGAQEGDRLGGATVVRGGTLLVSNNRQLGSRLVVGGGDSPAVVRSNNFWGDMYPFARGNCPTEILRNGTVDLASDGQSGTWAKDGTGPIFIRAGGGMAQGKRRFEFGSTGVTNLFLEGDFAGSTTTSIDLKDGSWLVRPATATGPLTIPSSFNINTKVRFLVEDVPDAPVDLTLTGGIAYGWHPRDAFYKLGAGVLRLTGSSSYGGGGALDQGEGTTVVRGGTLLVDNERGSGTGNSPVIVEAGAVLGGTGRIGGLTNTVSHWSGNTGTGENTRVQASGSADAQAVIAPGSIDAADGSHLVGTLTVGVKELHHPVTFGDHSTLRVAAGAKEADKLAVHGTVDVSATGTVLELSVAGRTFGGTFTILEADEITGTFETVVKPKASWQIAYETETDNGETIVRRIVLTVPPAGTVIVVK